MYPTVETMVAQGLAAVLVVGSYYLARYRTVWLPRRRSKIQVEQADAPIPTATALVD
jgi:high-affinity iron transporter